MPFWERQAYDFARLNGACIGHRAQLRAFEQYSDYTPPCVFTTMWFAQDGGIGLARLKESSLSEAKITPECSE